MRTVREASASFECCRDSCFGLIGRHADVDVGPATPRLGRAEALERHVRVPSVPIDDVLFRSKAPVPEGCGPERTDVAACILCHRDAHDLDLGGVRLDPQLPSFCRNLACQLDITMAQSSVLPGGGPDGDSLGSHVHVGEVAHNLRNVGDRGHEPCCFRERSDAEVGVGAREEDPPVLDSGGVVECPSSRSLLAHGAMLPTPASGHTGQAGGSNTLANITGGPGGRGRAQVLVGQRRPRQRRRSGAGGPAGRRARCQDPPADVGPTGSGAQGPPVGKDDLLDALTVTAGPAAADRRPRPRSSPTASPGGSKSTIGVTVVVRIVPTERSNDQQARSPPDRPARRLALGAHPTRRHIFFCPSNPLRPPRCPLVRNCRGAWSWCHTV